MWLSTWRAVIALARTGCKGLAKPGFSGESSHLARPETVHDGQATLTAYISVNDSQIG